MNIIWDISVGNILTILGGLVATIIVWQKLNDRVEVNAKEVDKHAKALDELTKMALQTTLAQHERRLVELEMLAKHMATDVAVMKENIQWIRDTLKKKISEENER